MHEMEERNYKEKREEYKKELKSLIDLIAEFNQKIEFTKNELNNINLQRIESMREIVLEHDNNNSYDNTLVF